MKGVAWEGPGTRFAALSVGSRGFVNRRTLHGIVVEEIALGPSQITPITEWDAPVAGSQNCVRLWDLRQEAALHWELEELVASGLSPIEALRAATSEAALILGMDDLGRIAEDVTADILLLNGNPLEDIRNSRLLWMVIKGGRIQLGAPSPSVRSACPRGRAVHFVAR